MWHTCGLVNSEAGEAGSRAAATGEPGRDVARVVTLFRAHFEQATLAAERGQDRATVFLGHGSTGATSRKAATLTKGDGKSFIF